MHDKDATLFNLSLKRHFPCKYPDKAIQCDSNTGPWFGLNTELAVQYNSDEITCTSFAEKSVYKIPLGQGGINMLTNLKDGTFKISELEVWSVKLANS